MSGSVLGSSQVSLGHLGASLCGPQAPPPLFPPLQGGEGSVRTAEEGHFPEACSAAPPPGPCLLAGGAGLAPICHALMSSS